MSNFQRNNLKILTWSGAPKTSIRHTHVSHSFIQGFHSSLEKK